jgi:hypothetical protein
MSSGEITTVVGIALGALLALGAGVTTAVHHLRRKPSLRPQRQAIERCGLFYDVDDCWEPGDNWEVEPWPPY